MRLEQGQINQAVIATGVQIFVLALSAHLRRHLRFPCLWASLLPSPIPLALPAFLFHPHSLWEEWVWGPAVFGLIPIQSLACMEAVISFGSLYRLAARISAVLSLCAAIAAYTVLSIDPYANLVGQLVVVAKCQRVGCLVLLILTLAFYLSTEERRGLWRTVEGRHLMWMCAWMGTWTAPIMLPMPGTWEKWVKVTWMIWGRVGLLLIWVPLTTDWITRQYLGRPAGSLSSSASA